VAGIVITGKQSVKLSKENGQPKTRTKRYGINNNMIEYMNIPALVCVSLLGAGALAMIVGSLLKMQWATEGKKTSLFTYLLCLIAMAGSGWTWYDSIHKARALAEGNRYTLATYEKVSGVIKGGHKVRQFGFYVDGVKYNTTTTYPKFLGVSNPLRIIVRYAVSNPEYNKAFGDEFVPTWVLSPPKKGWKQYPPAIHWEGAVLDSVYMQSLQGNN
jgi:hypothetical protein